MLSAVKQKIETARQNGLKIILVTGVFDILHQEHLAFLEKAKALGYLFVAIESDPRVRQIKGDGRPVNSAEKRQHNLEATGIMDQVVILPESFGAPEVRQQFLDELKPNVLAVSSHTAHLDKKRAMMEAIGGTLEIVHQHNPNVSTTQLLMAQKENDANSVS